MCVSAMQFPGLDPAVQTTKTTTVMLLDINLQRGKLGGYGYDGGMATAAQTRALDRRREREGRAMGLGFGRGRPGVVLILPGALCSVAVSIICRRWCIRACAR